MTGTFALIVGVIIILVSVIVAVSIKRRMVALAGLAGVACIVMACCAVVPTGFTGIVTTFGKVDERTLDAGFNLIAPWKNVITVDNREQKINFHQSSFSSDIQEVDVTGSVVFSLNRNSVVRMYSTVGLNYTNIIVTPQINEDVKGVISRYTAEGLIIQRATLSAQILDVLREDLSSYGINVVSVAVENIDFTDAFENAVEAKQVATQTKQKAQTEQEQMTMETQQAAERQRITAQAAADVAKIEADAQAYAISVKAKAEADANALVASSLTDRLVNYTQVNRWNGELPATFVGNGDMLPVLSLTPEADHE